MSGGKNKQPLGYTIIEVMIVLAISGLMFLIAAQFINGKQEKTAFTAGVNEMASELQDVIEQVTDGRYTDIPLNCRNNGITTVPSVSGNAGQGTNSSCVFLGKIVHFQGSSPAHSYEVDLVAGGRLDSLGNPATLQTAEPAILSNSEFIVTQSVPEELDVKDVEAKDLQTGALHQSFALAFLQSEGSVVSGTLENGAQTVSLYYLSNTGGATNPPNLSTLPANFANSQASSVDICMSDGKQQADINLGGNDNQLSVNVIRGATQVCPVADL